MGEFNILPTCVLRSNNIQTSLPLTIAIHSQDLVFHCNMAPIDTPDLARARLWVNAVPIIAAWDAEIIEYPAGCDGRA